MWPRSESLHSARLDLEPPRVEHAAEMAPLLDDADLHRFTGRRPASGLNWRRGTAVKPEVDRPTCHRDGSTG